MAISKEEAEQIYKKKKSSSKLTLPKESFVALLLKTKKCKYSGDELNIVNTSVERINPLKGYITSNIIFTTISSNVVKGSSVDAYFHLKNISPVDKFKAFTALSECISKGALSRGVATNKSLALFYNTKFITKQAKLNILELMKGFLKGYHESKIEEVCDKFVQEEIQMIQPEIQQMEEVDMTTPKKMHILAVAQYSTLHLDKALTANCRVMLIKNGQPTLEFVFNKASNVALNVRNGIAIDNLSFSYEQCDEIIIFP